MITVFVDEFVTNAKQPDTDPFDILDSYDRLVAIRAITFALVETEPSLIAYAEDEHGEYCSGNCAGREPHVKASLINHYTNIAKGETA